jgi:hypothetical protein
MGGSANVSSDGRSLRCNADDVQVLSWFWPFAATPDPSTGLEFEVNGFEGECIVRCTCGIELIS